MPYPPHVCHITLSFLGKRIRSDALQAFLKVLTFAYSYFYVLSLSSIFHLDVGERSIL